MSLSTFLNGRAPTQLRGLQFLALSESGVLFTPTATSDAGGGASTVWGTAGTVACRIDPVGGGRERRVTGGALDERSTHVITAPSGTDVSPTNRFVIAARGTFEVTAVPERTADPIRTFEVIEIS